MQYIISFLEGIITFISPCLLPMLPIYISYFAGGGERTTKKRHPKGCLFFGAGVHNGLKWFFANCSSKEQFGMGL